MQTETGMSSKKSSMRSALENSTYYKQLIQGFPLTQSKRNFRAKWVSSGGLAHPLIRESIIMQTETSVFSKKSIIQSAFKNQLTMNNYSGAVHWPSTTQIGGAVHYLTGSGTGIDP